MNEITNQKIKELQSEEFVRDSIIDLINSSKEKNLDVRTIVITLLEESMEKTFLYSHSNINAARLILSIFEKIADNNLQTIEDLERAIIDMANEDCKEIH
jgi:hypothetical protein